MRSLFVSVHGLRLGVHVIGQCQQQLRQAHILTVTRQFASLFGASPEMQGVHSNLFLLTPAQPVRIMRRYAPDEGE
jgi:hypothetical protein